MDLGESGQAANKEWNLAKWDLLKCQERSWVSYLALLGQVLCVHEAGPLLISEDNCLLKGQAQEVPFK